LDREAGWAPTKVIRHRGAHERGPDLGVFGGKRSCQTWRLDHGCVHRDDSGKRLPAWSSSVARTEPRRQVRAGTANGRLASMSAWPRHVGVSSCRSSSWMRPTPRTGPAVRSVRGDADRRSGANWNWAPAQGRLGLSSTEPSGPGVVAGVHGAGRAGRKVLTRTSAAHLDGHRMVSWATHFAIGVGRLFRPRGGTAARPC